MGLKSLLIYVLSVAVPTFLGFIISFLISGNGETYFSAFSLGISVVLLIFVYSLAQKSNIQLDLHNCNFEDSKSLLLNDLFVGLLISVPASLFLSILL